MSHELPRQADVLFGQVNERVVSADMVADVAVMLVDHIVELAFRENPFPYLRTIEVIINRASVTEESSDVIV